MPNTYHEIETAAIIPAHDEEGRVGNVLQAALRAELVDIVVVVDDGSTDSTRAEALKVIESGSLYGKRVEVVSHTENKGKTAAFCAGVDVAKKIGGVSLKTLVALDADSSPIWSRETEDNMKLWQSAVHRLSGQLQEPLSPEILEGRNIIFIMMLARYIDEIIKPVADGDEMMRAGMYHRNTLVDTVLSVVGHAGHAGNRAVPLKIWDDMLGDLESQGKMLDRWEMEGALNAYVASLGGPCGNLMMHGVVNVGSRVKAGSMVRGVVRMADIHSQALRGAAKTRGLGSSRS